MNPEMVTFSAQTDPKGSISLHSWLDHPHSRTSWQEVANFRLSANQVTHHSQMMGNDFTWLYLKCFRCFPVWHGPVFIPRDMLASTCAWRSFLMTSRSFWSKVSLRASSVWHTDPCWSWRSVTSLRRRRGWIQAWCLTASMTLSLWAAVCSWFDFCDMLYSTRHQVSTGLNAVWGNESVVEGRTDVEIGKLIDFLQTLQHEVNASSRKPHQSFDSRCAAAEKWKTIAFKVALYPCICIVFPFFSCKCLTQQHKALLSLRRCCSLTYTQNLFIL